MSKDSLSLPAIDDIQKLLRFESEEGLIWLGEERMILTRSGEMRALRRELINSLGIERAKGLLMRMGYVSGQQDADTARKLRPDASVFDAFLLGPQAHMVTGQVKVTPVEMELDEEERRYYGVFDWENSFEVEIYQAEYGISAEPVCWVQIGYASGYSSRFTGFPVLFKEVTCAGCGHSKCRIEGRALEGWEDADELLRYYQPDRIADRLIELQSQVISLRENLSQIEGFGDLVGCSAKFLEVRDLLAKAADSSVSVLLLGETGVGKDMFAKALHRGSSRSEQPFVAVNCAAIPKDLIESELFGVEKGAFTGADQSRPGRFERADGGTLFLDEVGQLSLQAQAALLRVLQESELERVGDTRTRHVDVRLVAASNEDLAAAVQEGSFRADLLYRLNVYTITVPPLRERIDDLAELALHFINKHCALHGKQVKGISDRAMSMLRVHDWPGNIRELANMIERGIILAEQGGQIEAAHLFPNVNERETPAHPVEPAALDQLLGPDFDLAHWERALMARALEKAGGNVTQAAKLLGLTRATLDYRLKKSGITS